MSIISLDQYVLRCHFSCPYSWGVIMVRKMLHLFYNMVGIDTDDKQENQIHCHNAPMCTCLYKMQIF